MNSKKYELELYVDRAVVEINGGCNYSCSMCPQTVGRGKDWLKKIDLQSFEKIIKELSTKGLNVVNLEGSGEPTLNKELPRYIEIVRKYGAKPVIYTNGYKLQNNFMEQCIDAGLYVARFSVIGYNQETYKTWMNIDAFNIIKENCVNFSDYVKKVNSDAILASYHLILDNSKIEYEVEQYRKNFIEEVGSFAEIWKMHNWSGKYDPEYKRKGEKRSCGRPFSPDITIRAGGSNGTRLTVAPCCQTLGRDQEADLGSIEDKSIEEVWNGEKYLQLRRLHDEKRFDEIPFCKDCDFLFEDNEVLVWKNNDLVEINKMKLTKFNLADYR